MIIRYASTEAIRAAYIAACGEPRTSQRGSNSWEDTWSGGENIADTLALSKTGHTALVPQAHELLAQISAKLVTPKRTVLRTPVGPRTNVAEFVAGVPDYARRTIVLKDEGAPITVLACSTSSGGIDARTLTKRGVAILALVMALSRVRPVTLHSFTALHGNDDGETVLVNRINTAPLDISRACYVLTSAGFARNLTYNLARAVNGFNGGWPYGKEYNYGNPVKYFSGLVQRLKLDPTKTLVIQSAEWDDPLVTNPVPWIQREIDRFVKCS